MDVSKRIKIRTLGITKEQVLNAAETWLHTPWHPNAALKGIGADCVGFIEGVSNDLGLYLKAPRNYKPLATDYLAVEYLNEFYTPKYDNNYSPGDLLLFEHFGFPSHFAFYCGNDIIIHANKIKKEVLKETLTNKYKHKLYCYYEIGV